MNDTRDRIIAAAGELFQRHGYTGTGLKQISRQSGAPFGSLYHFFPGGKEELTAETLRSSGLGYQLLVEAVFDSAPDLLTGLHDCFVGAAEVLTATDFADACPIETVALEVASSNESLRLVTAKIFESWIQSGAARGEAEGLSAAVARRALDRLHHRTRRSLRPRPSDEEHRAPRGRGRATIAATRAALDQHQPSTHPNRGTP